jgi:hypothetical protein
VSVDRNSEEAKVILWAFGLRYIFFLLFENLKTLEIWPSPNQPKLDVITPSTSNFDDHHAQPNYRDSSHNIETVCVSLFPTHSDVSDCARQPPQTKQGSLAHGCHYDCPAAGSGSLSPKVSTTNPFTLAVHCGTSETSKKSGRRLGNAWLGACTDFLSPKFQLKTSSNIATVSGSHNRKIPASHFSSARARRAASIVPSVHCS